MPAPTISGWSSLCDNSSNNNYYTEAGMTNYVWNISPGGTITAGAVTNSILVTWFTAGNQWVSVNYTTPSGCSAPSPTQFNVTVNPLPDPSGIITGTPSVCGGTTSVSYSVEPINHATTYIWDVLIGGATISSGNGSTNIFVDFGLNATSGNITVKGSNLCGDGLSSPNYPVTVNPIPVTPVITLIGDTLLSSSAVTGNQWYKEGNPIPLEVNQTYKPTVTAHYWSIVTLNGCSSAESNHIYVVVDAIPEYADVPLSIYPNPNDGSFTVTLSTSSPESYDLQVFQFPGNKSL